MEEIPGGILSPSVALGTLLLLFPFLSFLPLVSFRLAL